MYFLFTIFVFNMHVTSPHAGLDTYFIMTYNSRVNEQGSLYRQAERK